MCYGLYGKLAAQSIALESETYGTGYVYLRYVRWQHAWNLRNRCNFQRRPNDNNQVHLVSVMVQETAPKFVGEIFPKESDVGLSE